jgi:hypothetical protein
MATTLRWQVAQTVLLRLGQVRGVRNLVEVRREGPVVAG